MKIFNFLMVGNIFADDGELHTDGVLDLEGIHVSTFDDRTNLTQVTFLG